MSERDQFEAWAKRTGACSKGIGFNKCLILGSEIYDDPILHGYWSAWQASREALKAEHEYPDKLPCPVLLEPGMRFGKGVPTRSMLGALHRRAEYYAELEEMTPDQRAEQDEAIQELRNMLKPADAWIACSERMPNPKTGVMVGCWFGREWAVKWATYLPYHPDAHKSGFLMPGGSWTPTHWMPLPAPPSQHHPIDTTSQQYEKLAKGEE